MCVLVYNIPKWNMGVTNPRTRSVIRLGSGVCGGRCNDELRQAPPKDDTCLDEKRRSINLRHMYNGNRFKATFLEVLQKRTSYKTALRCLPHLEFSYSNVPLGLHTLRSTPQTSIPGTRRPQEFRPLMTGPRRVMRSTSMCVYITCFTLSLTACCLCEYAINQGGSLECLSHAGFFHF